MRLPNFPDVDLFSAGINALYGVLLASNPSHNRGYTAAGLLIMAFFGGIGGGVSPRYSSQRRSLSAYQREFSYRVPCDGSAGAGDLPLPSSRRRSGSEPERWHTSSLSRCPGLPFWARIRRSITGSEYSPRSLSGLSPPLPAASSSTSSQGSRPNWSGRSSKASRLRCSRPGSIRSLRFTIRRATTSFPSR